MIMLGLGRFHQEADTSALKKDAITTSTRPMRSVDSSPSSSRAGSPDRLMVDARDRGEDTQELNETLESMIVGNEKSSMTKRDISSAYTIGSSMRDVSFGTSMTTSMDYNILPVKSEPFLGGLPFTLEHHVQKGLERFLRLAGMSLEPKRSFTSSAFLQFICDERLRYMPTQGSRLDKLFKRAEAFAKCFAKFTAAMEMFEISMHGGSDMIFSTCKILISYGQRFSFAIEHVFSIFEQVGQTLLQFCEHLDIEARSEKLCSIFTTAFALIVDIAVDVSGSMRGGIKGEKAFLAFFEARFAMVLSRIIELKTELKMEILSCWIRCRREQCSKDFLLEILASFDFSSGTCHPSYFGIIIELCEVLHSFHEHEALKWYSILWASFEKHRHEAEISIEIWFDVFLKHMAILKIKDSCSAAIKLFYDFRAIIMADHGCFHHCYIRAGIELAKLLEADECRYKEAVVIYEEICGFDLTMIEERETIMALIVIAKQRLAILLGCHADLAHKAESLLIEEFLAIKLEFGCSHEKVFFALTRIIEYFQKHRRRDCTTTGLKYIEEHIIELLVEERDHCLLFEAARAISKLYFQLSIVEAGFKFLASIREELTRMDGASGKCIHFTIDQRGCLDRRAFVFIAVLENFLCGHESENMLDEIIRDLFTERCLYDAWAVAIKSTTSMQVRISVCARLLAFLELKGRQVEIRRLRMEMWSMFQAQFCSHASASDALWRLFELSLVCITKNSFSIAMLECQVDVALELFAMGHIEGCLELMRWSRTYFMRLVKTEKMRIIELGFKLAGSITIIVETADALRLELQRISSEILIEVLNICGFASMDFGRISMIQINVIIRILGEQKNYSMLERILQYLWDSRTMRCWSSTTTVSIGLRLCEVKFAAGHQTAAIALLENIIYNLRDVYGNLHMLTVRAETLRATFHNSCGNHSAARDIHVRLLQEIAGADTETTGMCDDLVGMTMDQARRLKWTCGRPGEFKHEEERKEKDGFFSRLLKDVKSSVSLLTSGSEVKKMKDVMDWHVSAEEHEDAAMFGGHVWETPRDWSLPIEGDM